MATVTNIFFLEREPPLLLFAPRKETPKKRKYKSCMSICPIYRKSSNYVNHGILVHKKLGSYTSVGEYYT